MFVGSIDARAKIKIMFPQGDESKTSFRTIGPNPPSKVPFESLRLAIVDIRFDAGGLAFPPPMTSRVLPPVSPLNWGRAATMLSKPTEITVLFMVKRCFYLGVKTDW